MIKILHFADVHLDSPFSLCDIKRSEQRRNELRSAFTSVMTYVRTSKIKYVLIPGDLFDYNFVTRETIDLVLREFEDMDYEQIAQTLRISVGTVKSRLNRAREKLRNFLEK